MPDSQKLKVTRRTTMKLGVIGLSALTALPFFARASKLSPVFATVIAGEPQSRSIILRARFSKNLPPPGDVETPSIGIAGSTRFEISETPEFHKPLKLDWQSANEEADFIIQKEIQALKPQTRYYYRVRFRDSDGNTYLPDDTGQFLTLPDPASGSRVSFSVFSCLSYELFFGVGKSYQSRWPWATPAVGEARRRGYPAMDVMMRSSSDFLVATGDTVYYDHPADKAYWATTVPGMREKWHRQFAVPSVRETLANHGTFWMKDDHDYRFDDADNSGEEPPSPEEGQRVFHEQVPVPSRNQSPYRTHRVNKHLQIWLLEGRDFRSPNAMPDTNDKTMWGAKQRQWLEKTLLDSDADFKIILSPTPIVGPDDIWKADNQTSPRGFQKEGEAFLAFLQENNLVKSTFIVNGDRHWKYHSIHPTGVEEFSCGTIHRQNSRPGVAPGDPRGTDPEGLIQQPYLQPIPDGGFLQIDVEPDTEGGKATILIRFWGEEGLLQHAVRRFGERPVIKLGR